MIYLTRPELLHIAGRVLGRDPPVRDIGFLESAVARPQATVFGADAYPDFDSKAAALLHSLARNHALLDGNKRLSLAALIAFYGVNGRRLTLTNDGAYDLVIDVATGQLNFLLKRSPRAPGRCHRTPGVKPAWTSAAAQRVTRQNAPSRSAGAASLAPGRPRAGP